MAKINFTVSRGPLVGAILLVCTLALAIWSTSSTSAQSTGAFAGAIFSVTPNSGQTFNLTSVATGSAFQVEGTITATNWRGQPFPSGGGGTFHRSGVKLASGFAVVTDVYVLSSFNGMITAEGVLRGEVVGAIEQADLLAVTGGVGTFRGASGEAQLTTTDPNTGAFTIFLQEARRLDQPGHFIR
ncbi:MAG: hypothetical protein AABO41_07375 [Acidobacteriota bacterium]